MSAPCLPQEDDSKKKAKQEAREGGPVRPKGKTLAEIEAEEGGPVKESLVGMAHVKRAANRKKDEKVEAEDTEVPAEVDKYEEEAEVGHALTLVTTGILAAMQLLTPSAYPSTACIVLAHLPSCFFK